MIDPDSDLYPLFCRRGLLVGADGGAVDHLDVAVVRGGDGVHQPVPDTCLPPSHEAVVAGGAWAVALRQVAPRRTGSQHPEDAVQHASVIHARYASGLIGQQRLDYAPLEVGQIVSAHGEPESQSLVLEKLPIERRHAILQAWQGSGASIIRPSGSSKDAANPTFQPHGKAGSSSLPSLDYRSP